MADPVRTDEKQCAHQPCTCKVEGERRFCSDDCEDENDSDPTSVCTCAHPGCKSNR